MRNTGPLPLLILGLLIIAIGSVSAYGQDATVFVKAGKVGIGVDTPAQKLHVKGSLGATQILVDETAPGEHFLFELSNPGKTRFKINNTTIGAWTFDVDNAARFSISRLGTGVNEFLLDSAGTGTFLGDVFAKGIKLTSSRDLKEAIVPLDEAEILERLMEVPVSRWHFKGDASEDLHVGPMAQDFNQAFGLSDDKHLSVTDVQGVALAAIQALNLKLERENLELRAEMDELRSTVNLLASNSTTTN